MFNLINRQVDDLRPGSAVGEKGKKKKNIRQALAPIANRKKKKERKIEQTNKQTGWESDESS